MRCDDVQSLLIDGLEAPAPAVRLEAMEHMASCEDCRAAQYAAGLLRVERSRRVPGPTPGAFERAIAAATRGARREPPPRPTPTILARSRGFWAGIGVGASTAAAASLVAWLALKEPVPGAPASPPVVSTPLVTLALHEPEAVSIDVATPAALADAEIRVVLTGAVSLDGFDGRELRWRTNLDAGSNQLTLPIIATAAGGGQLLVEVQHGQKRKTFVVDVRGVEA